MAVHSVLKTLTVLVPVALLAGPVQGEVYTVSIKGTVTEVRSSQNRLPPALASAQIGQPFTFRYFVHAGIPDSNASPSRGQYQFALFDDPNSNLLATVSVDRNVFVMPSPTGMGPDDRTLIVLNDVPVTNTPRLRDQLFAQKVSCSQGISVCFNLIVMAYQDGTATSPPTVFGSDALVLAPIALESFGIKHMRFYAGDAGGVRSQATGDSIKGVINEVIITSGASPDPHAQALERDPCVPNSTN
jgi:hypothetical protein